MPSSLLLTEKFCELKKQGSNAIIIISFCGKLKKLAIVFRRNTLLIKTHLFSYNPIIILILLILFEMLIYLYEINHGNHLVYTFQPLQPF